MADWGQKTINSNFDADTYMNKADKARNITKKSTSSQARAGLVYKVVGINANKVSGMIDAMESYISAINKEINKMNTDANSQQAFKGTELKNALNSYLNKVESHLKAVVSQIRAFEDKLVDVRDAWKKAQSNQATVVNKSNSSFATVSTYQRQKQ